MALELPSIFGDNMVLQQQSDARMWGTATAGAEVTATGSWNNSPVTTIADGAGKWTLELKTPPASFTNHTIEISDGHDSITIQNVLIGEVWLASGQSNMEMRFSGYLAQPVEGAAEAIASSLKYPGIRIITVPKSVSYEPQTDFKAEWKKSSPENMMNFSALVFFFARELTDLLDVPVGIISCAHEGSSIEGWLPRDILDSYKCYDIEAEQKRTDIKNYTRVNVMYNTMIHPLIGYNIRGFIWNQGESNIGKEDVYPARMADMIGRWRSEWNLGCLPFYFVELPPYDYGNAEGINGALFRECQHKAAKDIPGCGIVSTSDLAKPEEQHIIHASRKREIGERLAWMAGNLTYGIKGLPAAYPNFKSLEEENGKLIIHLNNAPRALTPNAELPGFEVAGTDGQFHAAKATQNCSKRTIIVERPADVDKITEVRYCFKNFAIGQVKDHIGMPLVPFRAKVSAIEK